MKRLVLLTLLLLPISLHALRDDGGRHPRRGHRHPEPVADRLDADFPADGGLVRTEVRSLPRATEERATDDARQRAEALIVKRLESYGVPAGWTPPREAIEPIVSFAQVEATEHDYGTVYVRTALIDDGDPQMRRIAQQYERSVASRRLVTLGGGLAFTLLCLAAVNGFIRADEATRGYYTRRLRLVAIASVGAAGVALYRWMA
jgi:hypothetical protein